MSEIEKVGNIVGGQVTRWKYLSSDRNFPNTIKWNESWKRDAIHS